MTERTNLERGPTGPLQGIRILDMTTVVNGAYATSILGDQGATVIKVEDPSGDIMRQTGHPPAAAPPLMGAIFLNVNRNKQSVVLNLRDPQQRATLDRLIETCDVFVTNVRYAGLKRLGLSYEGVKAVRGDIVYAHAAGYGADGPYAGEPAYDDMIQSACGMADLLPRVHPGTEPQLMPTLAADKVSGLFLAQALTAALLYRERTGEGQFVEVPMFECMTSFLMVEHLYDHVYDPPTGDVGYPRVINPLRKPFATRDGYISILPYSDSQWDAFFRAAGFDPATSDPRFVDFAARTDNIRELYALTEKAVASKTTQEWLDILKPLSIPAVKMNRLSDLETDPHLAAVGMFEHHQHPHIGNYKIVRPPVKFSRTPTGLHRHPPLLGEHTEQVLALLKNDEQA